MEIALAPQLLLEFAFRCVSGLWLQITGLSALDHHAADVGLAGRRETSVASDARSLRRAWPAGRRARPTPHHSPSIKGRRSHANTDSCWQTGTLGRAFHAGLCCHRRQRLGRYLRRDQGERPHGGRGPRTIFDPSSSSKTASRPASITSCSRSSARPCRSRFSSRSFPGPDCCRA